jgi:[ribosomal protein S5]-alanine N-acetyltransferase
LQGGRRIGGVGMKLSVNLLEPFVSDSLFLTPRLRCRRWRRSDLDAIVAVYADPVVVRWVGDGEPATREGCTQWLDVTERNYTLRGYGMFALEALDTGVISGFCGLVHPGGQAEPEVKYAFPRERWGQGLATEAVAALLRYGAEAHGLQRIIATVAPANLASQRVLEKVGARLDHQRANDDGSTSCVFVWRPAAG